MMLPYATTTTSEQTPQPPPADQSGGTVWLTGLSGAGKSTIAEALAQRLRAEGRRVEILDGDLIRENLSKDLGFSRADRDTNITRIGFVADLLARNGVVVISAAIAPFAGSRAAVRAMHAASGSRFIEVYVATPLDVCEQRDVKGLYAKQRAGQLTGLTGVDDPYEPPSAPDVTVHTERLSLAESVDLVSAAISERRL